MSDEAELIRPTKPARRLWQIHLSTLLLCTALTGTFAGLNVRPRVVDAIPLANMDDCHVQLQRSYGDNDRIWCRYLSYGWPMRTSMTCDYVEALPPDRCSVQDIANGRATSEVMYWHESSTGFVLNILIGTLAAAAIAIVSEWFIRRRRSSLP